MIGIENFQPKRLTMARQMYDGITKAALAAMINVSPSTITKWEDGTHFPQSEALTGLSKLFKIPEHWFLREIPNIGNPIFLNRATKRTLKSTACERSNIMLINLAEICMIADEWVDFPKVDLIPSLSRKEALLLDEAKISTLAENLREHWKLGKSPIQNLVKCLERAGIIITRFEIGYEGMDGTSTWINNKPYIFIASDKDNYFRSRFDLAHELGHLIMHRELTENDKKELIDVLEAHAHYFASCFLFPNDAFMTETYKITIEELTLLKKRWGMSIAAMIFKADALKIISAEKNTSLWKSYRFRKYTTCEPFDNEFEPEQPTLLSNIIKLLLNEGGFNKFNIVDKFGLKPHLEKLAGLPDNFLNDDFGQVIKMKVPHKNLAASKELEGSAKIMQFSR